MTDTEIKILKMLWENGDPMTASEMLMRNSEMKEVTVRKALKNMLEKKLLRVAGIKRTAKNYARTFAPIPKEQFALKEICELSKLDCFQFASALLEEESLSDSQLCKLKSIIDKRLEN